MYDHLGPHVSRAHVKVMSASARLNPPRELLLQTSVIIAMPADGRFCRGNYDIGTVSLRSTNPAMEQYAQLHNHEGRDS